MKPKRFIALGLGLLLSSSLPLGIQAGEAPAKQLEKRWDDGAWREYVYDTRSDGLGNYYASALTNQLLLIKTDSEGNELWRHSNRLTYSEATGQRGWVHLDSTGNVYWVIQSGGDFGKIYKFNPDGTLLYSIPGKARGRSICNQKRTEMAKMRIDHDGNLLLLSDVVIKYDGQTGTKLWQSGGFPHDNSCMVDFTFDTNNVIYVTGNAKIYDPLWGYPAMTARLAPDTGSRVWYRQFHYPEASLYQKGRFINIDASGNPLVHVTFAAGDYLLSYDPSGNLLASTPSGSIAAPAIADYHYDAATESIYLSPGGRGLSMNRYRWDGFNVTQEWSSVYAETTDQGYELKSSGTAMDVDSAGNSYVTGNCWTGGHWSSGKFCTAKFSPIGALEWAMRDPVAGNGLTLHITDTGTLLIGGGTYWPFDAMLFSYQDGAPPIPDTDGDGFSDDTDNCIYVANPDQLDIPDQDGIGNVCDEDDDNDGIFDQVDNCPDLANGDQADADADGVGDACDNDDDNDSVEDSLDNCPFIANTDQSNNDFDQYGDACDPDDDNDGFSDTQDNCPLIANPYQTDFDGDGQGDACDGDDDGDQIGDDEDLCPASPFDRAVDSEGCTGPQRITYTCGNGTEGDFANHGQYVKCVAQTANEVAKAGLINPTEKSRFIRAAAQAK